MMKFVRARMLPSSLALSLVASMMITMVPTTAFAQRLSIAKGTANEKGPDVGDRSIDFELPIVKGEGYVSLSDTYKQGPTILVFLRGFPSYQCPLCTQQVGSLINRAKALSQIAHRIVLVYPGPEDGLERNAEQFMSGRRLPESIVLVRDDGMKVVDEWGLRWDAKRETAYPATFVLDSYGRIAWKKVSASHAGRSSVEEILKELRKL